HSRRGRATSACRHRARSHRLQQRQVYTAHQAALGTPRRSAQKFLDVFGEPDTSKPEVTAEPAHDNQERESLNEAPNPTPEVSSEQPQGIPFVMTHAMKAALHAHGKSDDEILHITPTQAHEFLKSNGGWPPESGSPVS